MNGHVSTDKQVASADRRAGGRPVDFDVLLHELERDSSELYQSIVARRGTSAPLAKVAAIVLFKAMVNPALSEDQRVIAARYLRRVGPPHRRKGGNSFLKALVDPHPQIRWTAACCLHKMDLCRYLRAYLVLKDTLKDEDPHVRLCAIKALRQVGVDMASAALNKLRAALGDPVRRVQREIVITLGWLGEDAKPAVPDLVNLMFEDVKPTHPLLLEVVRALARIDPTHTTVADDARKLESTRHKTLLCVLRHIGPKARSLRRAIAQSNLGNSRIGDSVTRPASPAEQQVHKMVISIGETDYVMQSSDGRQLVVSSTFTPLFTLFVTKINEGSPSESVPWTTLNGAVSGPQADDDKASDPVRRKLHEFNARAINGLGKPPKGSRWIESRKKEGAYLNPSLTWSLSEKLTRLFDNSVYSHATDPGILAESQPDRGERLPAQSRRRSSRYTDEDES
jgi:hypothetical protein